MKTQTLLFYGALIAVTLAGLLWSRKSSAADLADDVLPGFTPLTIPPSQSSGSGSADVTVAEHGALNPAVVTPVATPADTAASTPVRTRTREPAIVTGGRSWAARSRTLAQ